MFLLWIFLYLMFGFMTACLQKVFLGTEGGPEYQASELAMTTIIWPMILFVVMPYQTSVWFYTKIF